MIYSSGGDAQPVLVVKLTHFDVPRLHHGEFRWQKVFAMVTPAVGAI
jgi:hypothetical protein